MMICSNNRTILFLVVLLSLLCNIFGWNFNIMIQPLRSSVSKKKRNLAIATFTCVLSINTLNPPCHAAIETSPSTASAVIYKTGKSPEGLSTSPADSRKDKTFLRCMSNCKTDCQKPGEGPAKLDCVQDCQDQCCNSYEQCSFKIKSSTLGNGI